MATTNFCGKINANNKLYINNYINTQIVKKTIFFLNTY